MKPLIGILTLLFTGILFPSPPQTNAVAEWQLLAEMPTARSEMASAELDGKIYVAGGINFSGSLKAFEVYDTDSNAWRKLAPLPKKLNHAGLAALEGKIYLSGGFTDLFQKKPSGDFYIYDPLSDTWSERPKMPAPRATHSMISHGGRLHVIGGRPPHSMGAWTFDPDVGTWQQGQLPPLPQARDHLRLLNHGEDILVVGGRNKYGPQSACLKWSPGDNEWKQFAKMDYPRGGHAAAAIKDKIYVTGGEDLSTKKCIALNERYEPEGKQWKLSTSLPRGRHGMVSELVGKKWYVIGGANRAKVGTITSCSKETLVLDLKDLP